MKLRPLFLFAIAALTAPAALEAADFEGKVRMKMTIPRSEPREVDYFMKAGFARSDIAIGDDQKMSVIMDFKKQEMITLMPGQNMYMVHSLTDVSDVAAQAANDENFSLEKTGETEKILGYECVKYISKSNDLTTEMWLTDKLGRFAGIGSGNPMSGKKSKNAAPWEKALQGKDFFPLRSVSKNKKGVEQYRLEAVAIEKSSQPDALFAPPPGAQKFEMRGMLKGLIPGMR